MVIKWSDFAKDNLKDFVEYSKKKSPIEYVENLVSSVYLLIDNPEAGKALFEMDNIKVRQLIYEKHRILYRISGNEIHIGAVLHVSQNLENNLKFARRFFKK